MVRHFSKLTPSSCLALLWSSAWRWQLLPRLKGLALLGLRAHTRAQQRGPKRAPPQCMCVHRDRKALARQDLRCQRPIRGPYAVIQSNSPINSEPYLFNSRARDWPAVRANARAHLDDWIRELHALQHDGLPLVTQRVAGRHILHATKPQGSSSGFKLESAHPHSQLWRRTAHLSTEG